MALGGQWYMSNLVKSGFLLFVALVFVGCSSDPHMYNPNATYGDGSDLNGLNAPGGGGPIVGEGGFTDINGLNGGAMAIPGEGAGTPVNHPFTTPVYFAYDSAVVGSTYGDMLSSLTEYLNNNPNYHLTVTGHCDERGSEEYNRALSERRALAVKDALVAKGAPAARVNTVGYGEERPADTGKSPEAFAKNRRAEFEIFAK
jgi:peptidoglycan-associated lipoprotein